MSADTGSYRQIFASTSIIGGSSVINVVIGVVRMKAVAVLLGPAGVGLVGLLTALMSTAATISQLGLSAAGVRQIAEAHASGDGQKLAIARRALAIGTLALAILGGGVVWMLRKPLAEFAIGDAGAATSVGLVGLGVALSVATSAQMALIRGMRRMWDLAWISILGALGTTLLGVPLVWWGGEAAAAAYVLVGPAISFALGHFFVSRLPKSEKPSGGFDALRPQWAALLRVGIPLMGAGLAMTLVELWIRIDVRRQLGDEALGHFQASWTIAAQYVGFVLGAMGADYYPRLTGVMPRPAEAVALVNQQTEVALLLAGPAIIAMLGLAPWVVEILYSQAFSEAADMLRWQALATALKVASWPLGFIILAAGAGRTYFITETVTLLLMAGLAHGLMMQFGLAGAGLAYLGAYVFYLPMVYLLARRRIHFRWTSEAKAALALTLALSAGLLAIVMLRPGLSVPASAAAFVIFGAYAGLRLHRMGLTGLVAARFARAR